MSYTDPCTIAIQMEETYRKIHNMDESIDALIEDIEPSKFDVESYLNSNYDYWNEQHYWAKSSLPDWSL